MGPMLFLPKSGHEGEDNIKKKNHISSEKKKLFGLSSTYMISEDGGRPVIKKGVEPSCHILTWLRKEEEYELLCFKTTK